MSNRVEKVFLKLTSAIAVDGLILRAGHVIEVLEHEAKDLLRRGKAVLATIADHPQAGPTEPSEASTALQDNPPSPVDGDEPETEQPAADAVKSTKKGGK